MQNLVGQRIKGYELREMIGAGGFGAVYRAYQPQVGREVAIKIILPQYANHPDFIRRFEVEAQVIARLEHPHIIPLYDYWRDADGAHLVMRYLRGGSLRSLLKSGERLSLEQVDRMLDQIAGALAVAHRQGVVHRDIKPDNILFDPEGNAYLTDFGIAKDLSSDVNVTQGDMVVGSPAYLSPEQVKADPVTAQSDIYCLGIVLYEVLAGSHPFADQPMTTLLMKHLQEPLPPIRDIRADLPDGLEQVIARATAKKPEDRFADAPALATAFRKIAQMDNGLSETSISPRLSRGMMLDRALLTEELDVDNPYKGLQAFEEIDSSNFFGREALVERLLAVLRDQHEERFLTIVGPSGSGKSSVIQAGVIPRIRAGTLPGSSRWFIVEMLPNAHPLEELEAALLRIAVNPPPSLLEQLREDERGLVRATKRVLMDGRDEILLFIDQFEETFTVAQDKAEVAHFLNSLAVAAADPHCRLRVLITLRADFYDQPLLYPAFGDLVRRTTEVVLPLTPEELEQAVAGPAERVGVVLEPGLVQHIIADVSQQPGALPLLQYALTELFERRSGRVMTLQAYQELGGALGALARRAEEIFYKLDARSQEAARQIFLRLVTLGEGGAADTRRRALHTELASVGDESAVIKKVIDYFGKARLLTFDHDPATREPTIEVAHEALIREWRQLRLWLEDGREDLLMQRKIEAAAGEWLTSRRESSYLASGARLVQFEEWRSKSKLSLNADEAEYLQMSTAQREAQLAQEVERQAREDALESRSRQRLRLLVAVMTIAAVIALGLAAAALNQRQIAQEAREQAESNAAAALVAQATSESNRIQAENSAAAAATAQSVADANRVIAEENAASAERSASEARSLALAANARNLVNQHNPNLGLALAIQAVEAFTPPTAEVQQTLASAAYAPGLRFRLEGHRGSVLSVASNGTRALSASADGTLILWDLLSGAVIQRHNLLEGYGSAASSITLSVNDETALVGLFDGRVILLDLKSGEPLRVFEGHGEIVTSVAFSPDGSQILSAATDRTLRLWAVESGEELLRIESPGVILRAAFGPDGKRAVTGSADSTLEAGQPPEDQDRTVRVWDLTNGAEIQKFEPRSGFVRAVAFSPDNEHVLSGSWNSVDGGTLQYWNIESGELERRFYGHTDIVSDVRFTADGQRILSASWDRSLRLWEVDTGVQLQRFDAHHDRIVTTAFALDESYVVVGTGNIGSNVPDPNADRGRDPSVWVWDLENRATVRVLRGHDDWVWSAVISPDGRYAATGSGPFSLPSRGQADTTVRLWDFHNGEQISMLEGHTNTVSMLEFSPDGQQIASASWDGTVRIWDIVSGRSRVAFDGHTDRVYSVAFRPDGRIALSTGCAAFDTGCVKGEIILWNVATGLPILRLEGHTNIVNRAVFSPDGHYVASASSDNTIRLWDAESGQEIRRFDGHTGAVNNVAFSTDGRQLLSASWDTTARLWDVASGVELRQFVGHSRAVFGIAFAPDRASVLTGSSDLSVRLWDIASGDETRRFDGHANWVLSVAFSPDGRFILTGAEDDTARIWHMARTMDELTAWATENRHIPVLTCAERDQYRVEPLCQTGGL